MDSLDIKKAQESFESSSAKEREIIAQSWLLSVAKNLELIANNGNYIGVEFKELDCSGLCVYKEIDKIFINEGYLKSSFPKSMCDLHHLTSIYIHECAHMISCQQTINDGHDFIFFTLNMALNFRYVELIKNERASSYAWSKNTLDMYNGIDIERSIDHPLPTDFDYINLGNYMADAVKVAYECAYDESLTAIEITKIIAGSLTNHETFFSKLTLKLPFFLSVMSKKESMIFCFFAGLLIPTLTINTYFFLN